MAASATAGALVAMGRRLGSGALPFSAIAHVFGGSQFVRVSPGGVLLGIAVHVVMALVWGFVFALLVDRWRGRTLAAAIVVAIAALGVSALMARVTGRGLAALLPLGDRLILYLVFAAALALGMRFAPPARETI